jgi:hypothetical protein
MWNVSQPMLALIVAKGEASCGAAPFPAPPVASSVPPGWFSFSGDRPLRLPPASGAFRCSEGMASCCSCRPTQNCVHDKTISHQLQHQSD